jgi:hypothetical protein
VSIDAQGFVVDVDPQPVDVALCTHVLAVPAELAASPFVLSVAEAGAIGAAIALLWGAAFGLRMLRRALDVG